MDTTDRLAARLDAAIAPCFQPAAPGAALIVTRDGQTVIRTAYGSADLDAALALNADMAFRLGSITKQFTAAAILLLARQGMLSLCDDFRKFVPGFPDKGHAITIEHLLTHTSGIPSFTDDPDYDTNKAIDRTVAQMIATFQDAPLQFVPGTRFDYNNSGYFLLGAVIEKISGQRYADFLASAIFEPLGMKHTAYEGAAREPVVQAKGYTSVDGGFVPHEPLSMTQPYAAGSLVSTVDDMARWDAAISRGELLDPAGWNLAFTSYRLTDGSATGYGFGWEIGALKGSPVVWHGGCVEGFTTSAIRLPGEKVYVAVLSNSDFGLAEADLLAIKAAAIAIGKPFLDAEPIALDRVN